MLNIVGTDKTKALDPHYRYKMPALEIRIAGSGNGIKTILDNLNTISKSLKRPPELILKYIGIEKSAQTKIKNDEFIINGEFLLKDLQNLIDKFIDSFVLCNKCKNPETNFSLKKKMIRKKCAACGEKTMANNNHKICRFILSHLQPLMEAKKKKKLKKKSKATSE